MIGVIVACILILTLFVYFYKNAYKRPNNFPPGPPSLPIYGAYWIILATEFNNLSTAFRKIGYKYKTKLVGLYLGSFPTIVLNDSDLIKEMLNREEFDGRMDIIVGRLRAYWKKLGIFFTDSYFWYIQRRYSLRHFRDFGFGRRDQTLEAVLESEVKAMIDMRINGPMYPAENELVQGELIYLPHYFAVPFINGMLHVISRMTLPRSDYHILWEVARKSLGFQRSSDDVGRALTLTPWLKNIIPKWSGYHGLKTNNQYLVEFFSNIINKELESYDESYQRHFLDIYIKKMKEEFGQNMRSTYSVDQLILICIDYMFPAASAVETVLTLLVERLLLQPEIQDKIHEEIDRVVGNGRLPNLDDRKNMPYTEACLREMMRYESIVPLGVPHRAIVDTTIGGYHVPENTMVAANFTMLHMDKKIWGDPENFRPERFIVDDHLSVASDRSLPFGAGRRLCAGETYARQAMFQVFAAFMQAFRVSTAGGRPLQVPAQRLQGIITTIPEYWVRVTPRVI
ncbi:probable cytochrome P450 304a1 [Achroia grisella]|uniref:probable cytochrome P450 304a1 n=1 Tax=Achroia grisella TaxID=688607 RepID=UPI0027D25E23|nr:probable cytochrome P450 304a1 [Achroia grisella]